MKALLEKRTVGQSCLHFRRLRRSVLGGALLASLLACGSVFGQGSYYSGPINPAGTVNYSTTTISSSQDLQFLQNKLGSLYPGVSLETPPTAAQYSGAVTSCVTDILNGLETGTGITLTTFSNQSVAWNSSATQATSGAIAQAIIQVDFTVNSNATQAINDLTTVATALSVSQPGLVNNIVSGIAAQAAQGASALQIAPGIPQIVAGALNQIPTDYTQASSVVGNGQAAIVNANLNAMQKHTVFDSYVTALIGSTAATNNPLLIKSIAQTLTTSSVPATVSTLQNTLSTAVAAMSSQTNFTLAALTDGALLSNGSTPAGATAVAGDITGAAGFTGNTAYVSQIATGYSQTTRANLDAAFTANPSLADATASGAVARGSVSSNLVLQDALTLAITGSAGDPSAANIVEQAMQANPSSVSATISGAVSPTSHMPYGTNVQFTDVAFGAAAGSPIGSVGTLIGVLVLDSSSSASTYSSTTVNNIVTGGINGAASSNYSGAYGDIVYKAEVQARNTTGISGSLVTAAISAIQTHSGLSYVAAIAAQAAGGTVGTNRAAIQSAADVALAGNATFQAAADQGMTLVQKIQTSAATHFVDILSAINQAANGTQNGDAVRSDLYAAMMADPGDYDGNLAAALKETVGNPNSLTSQGSPITDTLLLGDANNGIRGINSGVGANLQIVDTVVTHLQNEALGVGSSGVGDIFGYISQQVVVAPTLTRSIAVAATVTDPDHAHFIAKAIAYQAPMTVYTTVASIFNYAQITNPHPLVLTNSTSFAGAVGSSKTYPGNFGAIMDQPAAAAAITAGLTDGIIASNQALPISNLTTALSTAVAAAVSASITQNNTTLLGLTNPFNNTGDTTKLFQQSNGTTWNGATPAYTTASQSRTVGAAGAITGFIAEVTQPTDTTISPITQAVLTAAVGGAARNYSLQIAQAAGQAFAWVTQFSGTPDTSTASNTNPVYAIAEAMAPTVTGFATLAQLENAVAFGMNQAEIGAIGAGALGLNATNLNAGNGSLVVKATLNANSDFYIHRSGTGTPVTDIFNL
ncbi:MAG TPA: hypothetical protein VGM54_16255 [Chthoniobacter sp.]|jgi:hypothetical protein